MAHAPENTLASIRKAATLGVRWVEFDVALTKDHHPVLFHDETLDRTVGVTGRLADTELADIMHLDAGAWFDLEFQGQTVPTLEETVTALADLGLGANIEIKPATGLEQETGRVVAERVIDLWPESLPAPLFSSFSEAALSAAYQRAPLIARAYLVHRPDAKMWRVCRDLACEGLHVEDRFVTRKLSIRRTHGAWPFAPTL